MQTMLKQMHSSRRDGTRRTAWGLSLLALVLLMTTSSVAVAQDSGEWIDTKIIDKVLKGVGLRRSEKVIDYRERSPLVVPPNSALPPPQSDAAVRRNPDWPKDPDIARARERKKNAKAGPIPWYEDNRQLTPAELDKGRNPNAGQRTAVTDEKKIGLYERLWPSQLGYKGGLFSTLTGKKDEVATFKGEPPRTSLTDPPVGYRTPSSAQPYGIVTNKKDTKPDNSYITRVESQN